MRQDKYNRSYADFAPYYVLISASGKLSRKCETLSKLLSSKGNIGFSALFIGEKFNDFPKETKTVIHVNGRNTKLYDKDNTTGAQIVFDAEHADESILEGFPKACKYRTGCKRTAVHDAVYDNIP